MVDAMVVGRIDRMVARSGCSQWFKEPAPSARNVNRSDRSSTPHSMISIFQGKLDA